LASSGNAQRFGLLAWRTVIFPHGFRAVEILSPRGDLREAAATLFAKMRRLDEAKVDVIFAESVPEEGLGIAIMDRLRKAAHG
jgi:L-threonylcarbamoyladenylate synthase